MRYFGRTFGSLYRYFLTTYSYIVQRSPNTEFVWRKSSNTFNGVNGGKCEFAVNRVAYLGHIDG